MSSKERVPSSNNISYNVGTKMIAKAESMINDIANDTTKHGITILKKIFLDMVAETIVIPHLNDDVTIKTIDYINNLDLHKKHNTICTRTWSNEIGRYLTFKKIPIDTTFICKDKKTICIIRYITGYNDNLDKYRSNSMATVIGCNYMINISFIGKNAKRYRRNIYMILKKECESIASQRNDVCFYDESTQSSRYMPTRSFDSIICDNIDNLINPLNTFLNSKDIYIKYDIIYQFGILLYGQPGCGKHL